MNTQLYFESEIADFSAFLESKKDFQMVLLADAKTNGFCLPVLKAKLPRLSRLFTIVIPDGEQNKNLDICKLIWDALFQIHAGRNTILLNVGGGMLCDTGSFAASVYKRGIRFINIPTTLLSMTDAGIGGKTGVDFNHIKNGIGTFQHPDAVFIYTPFLKTLPERYLRSGISEMIKHGLLKGGRVFEQMIHFAAEDFYHPQTIKASAQFKEGIVRQDDLDFGIRQMLNFGHTIGHAIESFSLHSPHPLLHGEAIMLGMLCELQLSIDILKMPPAILEHLLFLKKNIFPELRFEFAASQLEPYLVNDKKNNQQIRMSLLKDAGNCQWQTPVTLKQIQEALENVHSLI